MTMTTDQAKEIGRLVERERRRHFGSKRKAYFEAGLNAMTWDKIEAGQPVRQDRMADALKVLFPWSGGDWQDVLNGEPTKAGEPYATTLLKQLDTIERLLRDQDERLRSIESTIETTKPGSAPDAVALSPVMDLSLEVDDEEALEAERVDAPEVAGRGR